MLGVTPEYCVSVPLSIYRKPQTRSVGRGLAQARAIVPPFGERCMFVDLMDLTNNNDC